MTDAEIIQKISEGEIDLFEILVKKYTKKMYGYIKQRVRLEDDVSDILQNSFIKVYKALSHFNTQKEFYPYFFSVVRNEMAEFYRKNPYNDSLNEDHESIPTKVEVSEIDFSGLKGEDKNILQLLADGYSYQEIADKIGRPINTIRTIIRRARLHVVKKQYEK